MAENSSSSSSSPPTISPSTPCHEFQQQPAHFNSMIIMAAMLCALVCALGLNSMLLCIFRCTQRAITEPVEWVTSRLVNSGLKKKEMGALPTSTYANSGSPSSASGCAICLVDFANGDKIRLLPKCKHRFHIACIDKWLLSHSSCPTCRHRVNSNDSVLSIDL